jgi:transcriptional regulator with XRE-family HTH domain
MVRRTQAGISMKQLASEIGVKVYHVRRWEFDRCIPSFAQWKELKRLLQLPETPVLSAPIGIPSECIETIGKNLKYRRLELRLCQAEVARILGVSGPAYANWETEHAFPSAIYHATISKFLGYCPFP